MLATFIIEIVLAVYTVLRYKLNPVGRLSVIILVCLAVFQVAEYNVCEAGMMNSLMASRLGFVAITLLPPLGIHLIYELSETKKNQLVLPAYFTGAAFIFYFLFATQSLSGHQCFGNYVIFQMSANCGWLYGLYYYGWMLTGIWLCLDLAKEKTKPTMYGVMVAYAMFILPTATVNLLSPATTMGIPSIMCGFAVTLALVLAFWVLPRAGLRK